MRQTQEKVMANTRLLRNYIYKVAEGRRSFVTDLDALACGIGIDSEDVRTAAAVLMLNEDIADILPAPGGRFTLLLQEN